MKPEHWEKLEEMSDYISQYGDLSFHVDRYHHSILLQSYNYGDSTKIWDIRCDMWYNEKDDKVIGLTNIIPGYNINGTLNEVLPLHSPAIIYNQLPKPFQKLIKRIINPYLLHRFCFVFDMEFTAEEGGKDDN